MIPSTENGKISARGRLVFKLVRNPTNMKENLGAPLGRLLLLGGRVNNKRYVPLIFRNIPLFFWNVPLIFRNVPLILRNVPLIFRKVPLIFWRPFLGRLRHIFHSKNKRCQKWAVSNDNRSSKNKRNLNRNFVKKREKKQKEKMSHKNEEKNRRPSGVSFVRGA